MPLRISLNRTESNNSFLVAPVGNQVFPASLGIRTDDGSNVTVTIQPSSQGAGLQLERMSVDVGPQETFVAVHATSASATRDDTTLSFLVDGVLEGSLSITSISNPRIWFDGRFEVRFATGAGFYNHSRGNPDGTGSGWMWALEDEPDFVPADSVPDRIEKPVGRVIRFHNPAISRPHVPPIGVFIRSVEGEVGATREKFTTGDPIIGLPVSLGSNSYFASNQPIDPQDRAAGRLPEERHPDGFQPIANFDFKIGSLFSGTSKVGPHVPGTVESRTPRNPDSRPYGNGLAALSPGEQAAYPFPSLQQFSEQRLTVLLPDFVNLKQTGQTNTVAFRNLRIRISHLLPLVNATLQQQVLADHGSDGVTLLIPSASFAWGMKEVYRGMINDNITFGNHSSPVLSCFSRFNALNFLNVFFNFHTDESCGHAYGAVDPTSQPPTL